MKKLEDFIDAREFRYFKGKEFTPYWSRVRKGVKNSAPPESLWNNIIPTVRVLDELRKRLGASIKMLSTYRSPAYNKAVGGESKSYHMKFQAIDFTCSKGTPAKWAAELRKMRDAGWFAGGIGTYPKSGFVHVDTRGYSADW